jgi:hypothetical protein
LTTLVADASAWLATDFVEEGAYVSELDPAELDDIDRAVASVRRSGIPAEELEKSDFPLPTLGRLLEALQIELEDGRGFAVLRGIPVQRYDRADLEAVLMGLLVHLGTPLAQDIKGTLIEDVMDRGLSYNNIQVRGYMTRAELTPHCDSGDVVALLSVRPAKSGGVSQIASAMSIYNEILASDPQYLDPLYRGFHHNIRGNGPAGEWENITRHRVPVYSYHKGRLSVRYNLKAMLTADQLPGVEPLNDFERAAIARVGELAVRPDLRLDINLRAGDIQFLNNHMILHTRTSFEDYDEPEKKRFLMRAWANMPNSRELVDEFADHFNTGPRQPPALKIHHNEDRPAV